MNNNVKDMKLHLQSNTVEKAAEWTMEVFHLVEREMSTLQDNFRSQQEERTKKSI